MVVHACCETLNPTLLKCLITNPHLKLDTNTTDRDGNSPLHVIMESYSKNREAANELFHLLLSHKANPNLLNDEGWGVLHVGIKLTQTEGIRKFIELCREYSTLYSLDLNLRGGALNSTPLQLACFHGMYETSNLFIKLGADIFAKNKEF